MDNEIDRVLRICLSLTPVMVDYYFRRKKINEFYDSKCGSDTKCAYCLSDGLMSRVLDLKGQVMNGIGFGLTKAVFNSFVGKDPLFAIGGGIKKSFEKQEKWVCAQCGKDWCSEYSKNQDDRNKALQSVSLKSWNIKTIFSYIVIYLLFTLYMES